MNIGNSASACSGLAFFSKTACAAAQHRSSMSVNSMAASRWNTSLLWFSAIFRSNGLSLCMGGPFVKLVGVETASVVKRAARHLGFDDLLHGRNRRFFGHLNES